MPPVHLVGRDRLPALALPLTLILAGRRAARAGTAPSAAAGDVQAVEPGVVRVVQDLVRVVALARVSARGFHRTQCHHLEEKGVERTGVKLSKH